MNCNKKGVLKMKPMKIASILVALLLIAVTFIPAVSAQQIDPQMKKIEENTEITVISDNGTESEYLVTSRVSATETQKYVLKKFPARIDGREVMKVEVYEQDADGQLASSPSFGKDSYYYGTGSGIAIHIGPVDMGFLRSGGTSAVTAFGIWLAAIIGLTSLVGGLFAAAIAITFIIGTYFYTNNDGSMDIFIPSASIALIPVYVAMPGPQPLPIQIKGMWTVVNL
jgi:hypothetical protein